MFDNSPPKHPDASRPRALTDDLLAVFDQHFLHHGAELLDGFDGLQDKKKGNGPLSGGRF